MSLLRNALGPCLALSATLSLASVNAEAAFVLIDDFESYADGAINGLGGWVTTTGTPSVMADPDDATNQTLRVNGSTQGVYKNIPNIVDGTTGTLFYQIRINGSNYNLGHGLADVAAPTIGQNTAFEVRVSHQPSASLQVDDSNVLEQFSPSVTLAANTWYSLWLVANNTTDTFRVFIQGGSYATQTELTGADEFGFKNGTTDPLQTFLVIANSSNVNAVYFDNLYIDTTGENLSNPIPEPATATTVLGIAALAALGRRRRV
jgi:hypothetical protein